MFGKKKWKEGKIEWIKMKVEPAIFHSPNIERKVEENFVSKQSTVNYFTGSESSDLVGLGDCS